VPSSGGGKSLRACYSSALLISFCGISSWNCRSAAALTDLAPGESE